MMRYKLKMPYRDGTMHMIFYPLLFISKLAALIPGPRVNLMRFHGVVAPNSNHRARVTSGGRGKRSEARTDDDLQDTSPQECMASMGCYKFEING